MIINIFKQGTGQAGPIVSYLFNEEKHKNFKPELVSGNPTLTKEVIGTITRKHKYTTGVVSFREGENLTEAQQHALINEFENTFAPFDDPSRSCWLWVRHMDKGRLELHFVHAMVDLKSGLRFNISPPGKPNQDFYKKFQAVKNYEFGFQQVEKNKSVKFHEYKQLKREVSQYIDKRIEYIILNIDNKKLKQKQKKENNYERNNNRQYENSSSSYGRKTISSREPFKTNHANTNSRTGNDFDTSKGSSTPSPINNSPSKSRLRNNDIRGKEQNSNVQSNVKTKSEISNSNPMNMQGYSLLSIDQKLIALAKSMETCPLEQLGQIYEEIGKLQKQKLELGFTLPNPVQKLKF